MNNEITSYVIVNQDNKIAIETGVSTLIDIINQMTTQHSGLAVAVNNDIVSRQQWPDYLVTSGDYINIFGAIAGG